MDEQDNNSNVAAVQSPFAKPKKKYAKSRKSLANDTRKFVPSPRVGRPTICNDEVIQEVCDAILVGCYLETAAATCGVRKETLYDWLRRGKREPGSIYEKFSDAVSVAMHASEMRAIEAIDRAAANGNWQAAAWRLERQHNARWRKIDHVDVNTNAGPQVQITLPSNGREIKATIAAPKEALPAGKDEAED
jgi:transposase